MQGSGGMKQMPLGEQRFEHKLGQDRIRAKNKREFLDEMNLVKPWVELASRIAPSAPAPDA